MSFKKGGLPVPVQFVTVNLQMYADDPDETPYNWTMDIGYISPEYQGPMYFDHFKENMLGLAPMSTDDDSLLRRQFLYMFTTTGSQKDMGLEESYAFNGGQYFAIGGTHDDYKELICAGR